MSVATTTVTTTAAGTGVNSTWLTDSDMQPELMFFLVDDDGAFLTDDDGALLIDG